MDTRDFQSYKAVGKPPAGDIVGPSKTSRFPGSHPKALYADLAAADVRPPCDAEEALQELEFSEKRGVVIKRVSPDHQIRRPP